MKRANNADYQDRVTAGHDQQSFVDSVAQQKIKALEQQVQQLVQQRSIISKFVEECLQHQNQNTMAITHDMMMHPPNQVPMHLYGAMPQQNFPGQQINIDMLTGNQGPQQPPIGMQTQGPPPPSVYQGGPPPQHFQAQASAPSSGLRRPPPPPPVQGQQSQSMIQKQGQAGAPNPFMMGQLGQSAPTSGGQQNDKNVSQSQERQPN